MRDPVKLGDLQSYPFLTKIMPSPSVITFKEGGNIRNEIYLALYQHILTKYREIWKPAYNFKDTLIKQTVNEVIPYYEALFGYKMPENIEIKIIPRHIMREGIYQVTHASSDKIKKYIKLSRNQVGNLAPHLKKFQTGKNSYQIPFYKVKNPKILIPQDQPIWLTILTLPHELFHAYMFSLTYQPPWSYQVDLHEFSTAEYTAEVMGAKFLSEEYGLKLIFGEPLNSYEYTLYKLDYLLDKKDSLKFIKNILTKEYFYDNEVFYRFNLENLIRISKAWRVLYNMTIIYGSFLKYTSLQHAVKVDYGIVFNLLNPEKIKEMYKDILNDANAEFYKTMMNIQDFHYKPYDITTDRFRILLIFSEKIRKMLVHYIPPHKPMSKEDMELILKFTQFGNPDPRKHPEYYRNKYRVRGLFEYFAYEPAVKKKVLKYKDFWQDPREVI